jgi:CRP-like cAMP-binding protein
MNDAKLDQLSALPLFRHCKRQEVAVIGRHASSALVPSGRSLIREGDTGREFFIILDGCVSVSCQGRELARLGAGDYFGELSLLDGEPCTATVTTATTTDVLVMERPHFIGLLDAVPRFARNLLGTVAHDLRLARASAVPPQLVRTPKRNGVPSALPAAAG